MRIRNHSMIFKMKLCFLLFSYLLFWIPEETHACGGHRFILNYARNCVEDPIIKLPDNYTVIVREDCMLELIGCLEVTKRFETAEGTFQVLMEPLPIMEGELDLCEVFIMADFPLFKKFTDLLNLPKKCPVEPMKVCHGADQKIDLKQFLFDFQTAARSNVYRFDIIHDNGKSCIELNFTVEKNSIH